MQSDPQFIWLEELKEDSCRKHPLMQWRIANLLSGLF